MDSEIGKRVFARWGGGGVGTMCPLPLSGFSSTSKPGLGRINFESIKDLREVYQENGLTKVKHIVPPPPPPRVKSHIFLLRINSGTVFLKACPKTNLLTQLRFPWKL